MMEWVGRIIKIIILPYRPSPLPGRPLPPLVMNVLWPFNYGNYPAHPIGITGRRDNYFRGGPKTFFGPQMQVIHPASQPDDH